MTSAPTCGFQRLLRQSGVRSAEHCSARTIRLARMGVLCLAVAGLFHSIHNVSGQLSVGPSGLAVQTFDAAPTVAEWSTLSIAPSFPSGITTGTQLDAAVETNLATAVNLVLPTNSTIPPAPTALAQWNSAGQYLQTRANGNSYTLLMAALRNDTGSNIAAVSITYDHAALVGPGTNIIEEIPGHRAYYSLTGATGTWVHIPDLNSPNAAASGPRTAALILNHWPPNALLYLLWADDNGSAPASGANQEGGYAIDHFASTAVPPQNEPLIVSQPASQTATPGVPLTFAVGAIGAPPLFYQWRKNSNDIAGATNRNYVINNPALSDEGFYSVTASNAFGTVASSNAFLTVVCPAPPAITNQPADQSLSGGGTITLSVGASGGPFTFQWYRDGAPLPGATNATYLKANAQSGDSGFYFVAVTNCASAVTSRTAAVLVAGLPFSLLGLTNSFWKYDQSGSNYGSAWKEVSFDDSSWPSGRGLFAAEDNSVIIPLTNTVLSLTGSGGQALTTYYFRTAFMLTNDPEFTTLLASNYIDDGAVFYLNGWDILHINMPPSVTNTTPAQGPAPEGVFIVTNLPTDRLVRGTNVLAVEVHQFSAASMDVAFGMSLLAQDSPAPPVITTQPASAILFPGQSTAFTIAVSRGRSYQWFQNDIPVPAATNSTFPRLNIQPADAGNYYAVASNAFGAVTSSVATLTVLAEQGTLHLLEFTNVWRFNQSGSNLGIAWRAPAYDDSGWPSGRGLLWKSLQTGFPEPTNTPLSLTNVSGNSITTYYFRIRFTLPAGVSNAIFRATNLLDDGAVFHLNGAEAARVRLIGTILATSFADVSPTEGRVYEPIFLAATNLVAGDNVLAVEVHQTSSFTSGSDVVFGMKLHAYGGSGQGLSLLAPPVSQTVPEGSPAHFSADVFGGQPIFYQWFRNGIALGAETNATLDRPAAHPSQAGDYFFVASNLLNAVTSSVATLAVTVDSTPPTLVRAHGTNGFAGLMVVFSEPVAAASATNTAHYALSPSVTILSAQLVAPDRVLLTTSGLDPQSGYTLSVDNIFDQADSPNAIAPASARVQPNRFTTATGLLNVQTVFIILMENQAWSSIKGSTNCPYFNSLLPRASWCEDYHAYNDTHPSAPNYVWLEAGEAFSVDDDSGPSQDRIASTNHLATQLRHAGIEWRGYMESMPYGSVGITNALPYLARHNPFAFFDDVTTDYAYCTNHVRPYDEFAGDLEAGRIGRYNFISPNITNDMHSFAPGSTSLTKQGDDWLARELPRILNSSAFSNNGAVFITWDENDYTPDTVIGMILLSPLAKGNGYASPLFYDHSSTLRTMQEIFGVRPFLGDAANASPLNDLFADLTVRLQRTNDAWALRISNVLPGKTTYVQSSSNLVNWTTLSTNVPAAEFTVAAPAAAGTEPQFYRAIQVP